MNPYEEVIKRMRWLFCRFRISRLYCKSGNLRQQLFATITAVCLLNVADGHDDPYGAGRNYEQVGRFCNLSGQCDTSSGETCFWIFKGCPFGRCTCDPQKPFSAGSRATSCRRKLNGDDRCTLNDFCPSGMECLGGRCRCVVGEMTTDGQFCMRSHHRFLGQSCTLYKDKCMQKAAYGYTEHDIHCGYTMKCRCTEGLKEMGTSCIKRDIGESGCKTVHHCKGGAVCQAGRCECPDGYQAAARMTKCTKIGEPTNRRLGEECNEIEETAYCDEGLVCQRCAEDDKLRCLQYSSEDHKLSYLARYSVGSGSLSRLPLSYQSSLSCCILSVYVTRKFFASDR